MTQRWSGKLFGPVLLVFLYPQVALSQSISVEDAPFKGDKNAAVTLIEFSDYGCPFCARHARETLPQIEKDYIKTGKIKYVFRNFPLERSHPQAFKAAEVAICAGEQGKYWEMHDRLFALEPVDWDNLSPYVQAVGLDPSKFQRCLDSEQPAAKVQKDLADGQRAGVEVTPTFFLGLTERNASQIKTLRQIKGSRPYTTFKEALDSLPGMIKRP